MKLFALSIPGDNGTSVAISPPPGIPSGSHFSIGFLAGSFIQLAMAAGIVLALFYLLYGGFFWIQSKGNKEMLDKARRIIVYSIFGVIVMSVSLVVVNFITKALGVPTFLNP